ncbi:Ribonuclease_H superfamily [Hexamita inflata]|uniref:Ribonuclease H superfamily n=1 Tax=Hexamita inflata TaxID=28002 RepID=A0AA86UPW6_9EUKA|nr:Ribonuclease H superfamily [Hexamita inflata]
MSNWEKFKQNATKSQRETLKPSKEQLQKAEEYRQKRSEVIQVRKEKKNRNKAEVVADQGFFNFTAQQQPDRMKPVIISHLSVLIQKTGTQIKNEHVCYIQLFDTKTDRIIYQSFIQEPSKFETIDTRANFQRVTKEQIREGKTIQEVQAEVVKHFSQEEFYCGYHARKIVSLLKQEILSSHIIDLQICQSFQGQDECSSYLSLLLNSGVGFLSKLEPEDMGKTQKVIYDIVKYKYDFEVAQYYKGK